MKKLFTLFSLLLISISGMLAANVSNGAKIYFDASEYPDVAKEQVVQLMIGHSGWSQGYKMDKVEGYDNIYLVTMPKWDGCTEFCFFGAGAEWGGESKKMSDRFQWMPAHTDAIAISSNVSGTVGFGGKPLKRTDNYQLPVKAPVITIGAAPEFATTTVGETSTATVKYTVENSEEKPKISLDNDAFTAEDAGGTITITFAPTEAKEYTATLTLTIGEVTASVEFAAIGKAEDAPKVPEILNLAAGEIAEIFAGETTEFEVTYTLQNAEEATVSIEGEGFTIKKQDKGTATIEFAPTEAKTYEAVVTVTSGETIKTLEISATAKKVLAKITITYVNTQEYDNVYMHAWGGTAAGTTWPGQKLESTGEKINGFDAYSFTFDEGAYTSCLFNCGGDNPDGCKTGDQVIDATKTYFYGGLWYATKEEIPAEVADVWTVVGAADLFEKEWDFSNTAYDMIEGEAGIYTLVIDEVALDAKDYAYKFVQNRSWSGAQYPKDGNYTLTVAEAASYKVTYTLDTKAGNGTCAIEKISTPTPPEEPKIIITSELPEFPVTVIGETSEATFTYEVENIDPDTEVSVLIQGEGFSVEDVNGTVTIIFTPTEVKVYTGAVTITAGEISQDVVLFAQAVAEEEPEEPKINIIVADFERNTAEVGDDTDAAIVYNLENIESAEVEIEGEYVTFEQTEVDEGFMIAVFFRPEEVGEFPGKVTITAGDVTEEIEFTFIATEPEEPEEPKINIIVADFESNTAEVGDGTDAAIVYSLENIESAEVEIEGEYVTFEQREVDEGFMIAVFFRPEEVGEFPGKVTITAGDVTEEIEFTFIATEPEEDPEYPKTITVKVACAWEACNIWAWYADGSGNVYTEWPGEAMTKGDDGFYAIDMTIASPVYFKVNAGAGKTESENYMTEVSESTCFNMNGLALVINEDCEYKEPVKIEPYYGIRGINGSWEMPDDIKLTEDADKAEWYITNVEVDGTQEFKVVYVDATGAATWYGTESVELQQGVVNEGEGEGNIILAAGIYDIYFKVNEGKIWIQFSAETPTDVEDATAELIYAVDGTIFAPAPFAIIDLSGKDVTNVNGALEGAYIVKTQNSVTKVLVK